MSNSAERKLTTTRFFSTLLAIFAVSFFAVDKLIPAHQAVRVEAILKGPAAALSAAPGREGLALNSDRVFASLPGGSDWAKLSFALPPGPLPKLELRLGSVPSDYFFQQICLSVAAKATEHVCWEGHALAKNFRPRRDISYFRTVEDSLHVRTSGAQPMFETLPDIGAALENLSSRSRKTQFLYACGISVVLATLLWFAPFTWPAAPTPLVSRTAAFAAFALLFGAAFVSATSKVSIYTPPLQGTDEPAHLSKYLSSQELIGCGELPPEMAVLNAQLKPLRHSPAKRFTADMLELPTADSLIPETDACRYNSSYTLLPSVFAQNLSGNPLYDVISTRRAFSRAALAGFLFSIVLVFFGSPFSWLSSDASRYFKAAGLISLIQTAFLPQTLWFSSTVSQDYMLINAGLFLALSLGLRIPILSELGFAVCLWVGSSKGVYLPPFAVLIAWHYLFVLKRAPKPLITLFAAPAALAAFVIVGMLLRNTYCASEYCYGLDRGGLFHSLDKFSSEAAVMFSDFKILSIPQTFYQSSAFGLFGWLDTSMSTASAVRYSAPLSACLLVGLICLAAFLIPRFKSLYPGEVSRIVSILALHWVVSAAAVYLIFLVMQQWCSSGGYFGCGYQRRYELPLYAPISVGIIFVSLLSSSRILAACGWPRRTGPLLAVLVMLFQCSVAGLAYQAMLHSLIARYFADERAIEEYMVQLEHLEL